MLFLILPRRGAARIDPWCRARLPAR